MTGTNPESPSTGVSRAALISNHVVRTFSEYTGRGPTKAWTSLDGDLVTVVLQDTLTKGERRLVADGRSEIVLDMRRAFQETMRTDLVAGVEEILDRRVDAFLSGNHIDPDVAVETFVLAPRPTGPAA
ncbi:MAG: hypothetical protein JWN65_2513 [Solirubrobacterales bacterium]|jgi:uncharacterized protein YbcI|nr:hypothetical protein [Solirubrobacterales bacterium]